MPFKIKPLLQKKFPRIQFLEFDPTENFPESQELIFLDTVINLKTPRLFTSIDQFKPVITQNLSIHNFDFYTELALREKIGLGKKYIIIGVPAAGNEKQIATNIVKLLNC